MNNVELSVNDLTLAEAVQIAGLCAKTLRRAAHEGRLPCRYVLSQRGPQLVFERPVLEEWLRTRQEQRLGRWTMAAESRLVPHASRGSAPEERVIELQLALARSQARLERVLVELNRQQILLTNLSHQLSQLLDQDATYVSAGRAAD